MALKGLVEKLSGKIAGSLASKPSRGPWQPAQGAYPRLMLLDPEALASLQGVGGLFVLWHRGVRPQWIVVSQSDDLATVLESLQSDADILLYDQNDGVFVSWAECPTENRLGAVAYLTAVLEPAIVRSTFDQGVLDATEVTPVEFPIPQD